MTIHVSKPIAYLLAVATILLLAVLLATNLRIEPAKAQRERSPIRVSVENTPLDVSQTDSESTKGISVGNTWLGSGESIAVVDVSGPGTFYSIWYSTTSEVITMRLTIDGEIVWSDHTGVFGYNWTFNKNESGIGGTTNYGDSTHLGPVYGGYLKPSGVGLPFGESLKIEFINDAGDSQLVYAARGFYSLKQ